MTVRVRRVVFVAFGGLLAGLLAWGFGGLTHFGAFGGLAVPVEHANAVASVGLDDRAFDTLGSAFLFLSAVLGVSAVLRAQADERPGHVVDWATGRAVPPTSDAVRVLGLGLTPLTVLFALYVIAHGHLTPGGGFQGGVILATGVLLIYLAGEFDDLHGLYTDVTLERAQAAAGGGFIAIGLVGMAAGTAFLDNVLPPGRIGSVWSAGTVPLIDVAVGLEIAAGLVLLLSAFLRQTIVLRRVRAT